MSKNMNDKLGHNFEDKDKKVRKLFEEDNSIKEDINLDEFFKRAFKDNDLEIPSDIHNGLEDILINLPKKRKVIKSEGH